MGDVRLQQSMGDQFHNRLVTSRTDIPRRTESTRQYPTLRTSTACSASREAGAKVAGRPSSSAISPLITSFRNDAEAPTTSKTFNCYAGTATASRATGRKSTW